jgi:hypothetical protein
MTWRFAVPTDWDDVSSYNWFLSVGYVMDLISKINLNEHKFPVEPGTVGGLPLLIVRRNALRRTSGNERPAVPDARTKGPLR